MICFDDDEAVSDDGGCDEAATALIEEAEAVEVDGFDEEMAEVKLMNKTLFFTLAARPTPNFLLFLIASSFKSFLVVFFR